MKAADLIRQHEGLSLSCYHCTAGKLTIGYGHNLDDLGITKDMAEFILQRDIEDAEAHLKQYYWFEGLDSGRKAAITDMMFNLGPTRFSGFHNMIVALANGEFDKAADEAKDSKWYTQVKGRGETIVRIIRTGA
jgi:lysozyme